MEQKAKRYVGTHGGVKRQKKRSSATLAGSLKKGGGR